MAYVTVPVLNAYERDQVLGSITIEDSALTDPDLILCVAGRVLEHTPHGPSRIQVCEFGLIPVQQHNTFRQMEEIGRDTAENLTAMTLERDSLKQDVAVLRYAQRRAYRSEKRLADIRSIHRVMELAKELGDEWDFRDLLASALTE